MYPSVCISGSKAGLVKSETERSVTMRVPALRYPKAPIAAGLLAGIVLGYACIRTRPNPCIRHPVVEGALLAIDVAAFFKATRRAWNMRVPGL